jgi:hypothetical protein
MSSSHTRIHSHPAPTQSELSRSPLRFRSKKFLFLFVISMASAFLGAETVHRIIKPDLVVPHLPPDFEGLRKEREEQERNSW